jgi:hypothetical protein
MVSNNEPQQKDVGSIGKNRHQILIVIAKRQPMLIRTKRLSIIIDLGNFGKIE